MKRVVSLIVVFVLLIGCAFGMCGCDLSFYSDFINKSINESNNELGDYSVEILSCRFAKTYGGADAVIVKYRFANNNNNDAISFTWAVDDEAYQNGVSLNRAYVFDDSINYSSDNQTKELKTGASIELEVAYELNDTTTDIEVEVKELFGISKKTITKTFSIE